MTLLPGYVKNLTKKRKTGLPWLIRTFLSPNKIGFTFIHSSLSPLSLSSSLLSLLSLFSLSQGDDTKLPTKVDVSFNPNTLRQRSRKQILRGIFLFYHEIVCFLEAIQTCTPKISILCRRSRVYIPKLS